MIDTDVLTLSLPPGGRWYATRAHKIRLRAELHPTRITFIESNGFRLDMVGSPVLTGIGAFEIRRNGCTIAAYRRTSEMTYGPFVTIGLRPDQATDHA